MKKLSDIFNIYYGNGFELNRLSEKSEGINFVSRTAKNNGVSAIVEKLIDVEPFKPGIITVSLGGSVLEAFLQTSEFYTGYHIFCLLPKIELTEKEKLFYCLCIRVNKYRYNYGRQANKTLGHILIPDIKQVPDWVEKIKIPKQPSKNSLIQIPIELNVSKWKLFKYGDIFEIENGYYNKKPPVDDNGEIPFIGASEYENGVTSYHTLEDIQKYSRDGSEDENEAVSNKIFKGNCISVANNGNSVASAFYQDKHFSCTHDINVLRLKGYEMNKYIALFLCALIKMEKYRWSYGRKWRPKRMPDSEMKLPIDSKGNPDFELIERYIKTLPYSISL
jgi:hypothetical protein